MLRTRTARGAAGDCRLESEVQQKRVFADVADHAVVSRGRVRLATTTRLRWIAVLGQLAAVLFVAFGLGFEVPLAYCLTLIALSAWLNVYLAIKLPARHRLSSPVAAALLTYDLLQLAALLYFTGGIANPFSVLLVAPVAVSAATLPAVYTVALGTVAMAVAFALSYHYWPLPWYAGMRFELPILYKSGLLAAVTCGLVFIALYVRRLAKEGRDMSSALAATELVLAREQRLHALDGLAAAAAHELGTPLATIVLVTKELERALPTDSPYAEDVALLRTQADRCRDILHKLTRSPSEQDPMHASLSVREIIEEAAAPYVGKGKEVVVDARAADGAEIVAAREPIGKRQPGVLYGIGNIVENAVDFARTRVEITARWDASAVIIEIADDGPGFPPELMDTLGDPYVTTRGPNSPRRGKGSGGGMGLGYFIAKTLIERSGASLELHNKTERGGALVRIVWPRSAFAAPAGWPWTRAEQDAGKS
ncbi:MAG: ActS/PrrB/RegB family redox-sensitive histidine kinase [Hyphomicrobiaceae bacterium]|nr:ActS/PrrB/RegB family redox-sensitive histidine kinase [Hyphomicrobiaceae bacterium]